MKVLLTLLLLAGSTLAVAAEYECILNDDIRYIRMDYPGVDNLCEVSVTTPDNQREVKWYANGESTFCSRKLIELAGKHQNQWGFSCTEWPDRNQLDELNTRQRSIVDSLVKSVTREGKSASSPFTISGVRALAQQSDTSGAGNPRKMIVQLFMDDGTPRFANRAYFVEDTTTAFDTTLVLSDIHRLVDTGGANLAIESAVVDGFSADGTVRVTTTLSSASTASDAESDCIGEQHFSLSSDNTFGPANSHRYLCYKPL